MLRVGLTGGIASGKTTISKLFADLGVPIIDTDIISHQLMQPGEAAYLKTVEHFGSDILKSGGSLNRPLLRERVFQQPVEKQWLEQMLHPLIRRQTIDSVNALHDAEYCLIVVPLLFETGFDQLVDKTIAIDCPPDSQKARLLQRDAITAALADQMLQSQMSNDERIARADFVLHNPDKQNPQPQVTALHQELSRRAQQLMI